MLFTIRLTLLLFIISLLSICRFDSFKKLSFDPAVENKTGPQQQEEPEKEKEEVCTSFFDIEEESSWTNYEFRLKLNGELMEGTGSLRSTTTALDPDVRHLSFYLGTGALILTVSIKPPYIDEKALTAGSTDLGASILFVCGSVGCINSRYVAGFINGLDYGSGHFTAVQLDSGGYLFSAKFELININEEINDKLTITEGEFSEILNCEKR
jgi:hypothetical protein